MIQIAHEQKTLLERIPEWLATHPESEMIEDFFTCIHEGTHVTYYRDLGFDPKVYGPHWIQFDGERRWVNGSVQGLPQKIRMTADPVLIGKSLLGPAYLHLLLEPDED